MAHYIKSSHLKAMNKTINIDRPDLRNEAARETLESRDSGRNPSDYIDSLKNIQRVTKDPRAAQIAQQEIDFVRKNDREFKRS